LVGGLFVGAIGAVLLGDMIPYGASDKGLMLTLALGLYGALVGGIHCALWNRVGKARVLGPDLRGADLRGRTFRHPDLRGADLRGADLSGADLTGANLAWARLDGARLAGARLVRADLHAADLRNADVTGADLNLAILPDGTIYRPRPPRRTLRFRLWDTGLVAWLLSQAVVPIFATVVRIHREDATKPLGLIVAAGVVAAVVVVTPVGLALCHVRRSAFRHWQRGCPNCRSPLPSRRSRTWKQWLRGGWACAECGAVFNAAGKMRNAPDPAEA
jgi:hypothetical protein